MNAKQNRAFCKAQKQFYTTKPAAKFAARIPFDAARLTHNPHMKWSTPTVSIPPHAGVKLCSFGRSDLIVA